jgi:hypothetical protein
MLADTRSKVWPVEDMHRVVDERRPAGYPMPPMVETHPVDPKQSLPGFYGPGFVGPIPQQQTHVLPQRQDMRPSTIGGMVASEEPVAEDEYRLLMNKLRAATAQEGPWR